MIEYIDFVLGLQNGDEGKGAVAHSLASRPEYNLVMRCQGGSNAGHTIFHQGNKVVTHLVPCGFMHNKVSIIGSGCVVNVRKFFEEINYLKQLGFNTNYIYIADNAHVVTEEHISEEANEAKIGTTKQGIGPAYRDKYARKGLRAKDVPDLAGYTINLYELLHEKENNLRILVEGAQGFELDIDHGDYPYVTSSHTTLAGCLLNLLPHNKVRKVYGCIKAYETYVGSKSFQDKNDEDFKVLEQLADLGNEYGSTTGRRRQCNWIDEKMLKKASVVNCVTHLIISKMDILTHLNNHYQNKFWKTKQRNFDSKSKFIEAIKSTHNYASVQIREFAQQGVTI